MISCMLNSEKIWNQQLYICPPHLYTVATLPWEIQKSNFQQYYSYILQIIYVISKQNKLLCLPPYPAHLKMSPHYLAKCTTSSFDWRYVAFLQTLVALKKASCGVAVVALKRTGCDVWKLECQASNITAKKWPPSARIRIHTSSLKSPLINCTVHHALLKFSPCRSKTLLQLVRISDWYLIRVKKWKRWKICAFYKVVRWLFSGVVGKRVTVCFLLR